MSLILSTSIDFKMRLHKYIKLKTIFNAIKYDKYILKTSKNIDIRNIINIIYEKSKLYNSSNISSYLFLNEFFTIFGWYYWHLNNSIEDIIYNFKNLSCNYNDNSLLNKKKILERLRLGKINNRVTIICKRVTQNIFLTLVNSKGDVLKRISFGYFLSIWSGKINRIKKNLHSLSYNLKLKYIDNKKKYQRAKAKIKNSIRARRANKLLHLFCNKIIPILSLLPLNVIYIDIIFINLENNFREYFNVFYKRLRLVNKKRGKRLKYYTWRKYKKVKKVFKRINYEFESLLNICLYYKNLNKTKIYRLLIRRLIKYYIVVKYYISGRDNKKNYNKYLNFYRVFFLNMLQLNSSYLYY